MVQDSTLYGKPWRINSYAETLGCVLVIKRFSDTLTSQYGCLRLRVTWVSVKYNWVGWITSLCTYLKLVFNPTQSTPRQIPVVSNVI